MSDGCQGVVDAWRLMQSNHSPRGGPQSPRADPKPEWLAFARKYGDFLVANQAMDGSIAGESLGRIVAVYCLRSRQYCLRSSI